MAEKAKVLLADDHSLYRESMCVMLSCWDEICMLPPASNGLEAVELCRKHRPDIVLMDIEMPLMNGVEATRIICEEMPDTAVIMLTVSTQRHNLFEALRGGARGYVTKDVSARRLREQLQEALRGEAPLSSLASAELLAEFNRGFLGNSAAENWHPSAEIFTDREKEILRLLAQGHSNDAIGRALYISEGAVKKQLNILMQKAGFSNRVQAAVYAVKVGIAD